MKLHRKAKTTPMSRAQLIHRVLHEGWTYQQAAVGSGLSRRTVAKWVARFRQGGVAALEDRSSRPHQMPAITAPALVTAIQDLRQQHRLPAWAIGRALALPRSTVSAWLRRLGLNRLPVVPAPGPVHRYEWPRPGDLLHLDIKPLGRFRQPGHRVHGNRRLSSRGIGWEYVHVAIDDHTRVAYVEVLPDQHGTTCAAFLQRAVTWWAARRVTVARVLTDNGAGYVSRVFRAACERLHVHPRRTRPYRPRTNGKAERFIQTLLREWAYAHRYQTSYERRQALRPWLRFYNHERLHASLAYQTPWSRLKSAA